MTAVRTARATTSGSFSGIKNRISSCQNIQIGVRPTHSLGTGTGSSMLGDKEAGARNWKLNSINADSKNKATEWSTVPLANLMGPHLVKKFPAFLKPEGSLQYSQQPATIPRPQPCPIRK
jgi:hypothetical protein